MLLLGVLFPFHCWLVLIPAVSARFYTFLTGLLKVATRHVYTSQNCPEYPGNTQE